MSRHYNCKHPDRGTNQPRYHRRLKARGQSPVTVRMETLEKLRERQERRVELTGFPWPTRFAEAA